MKYLYYFTWFITPIIVYWLGGGNFERNRILAGTFAISCVFLIAAYLVRENTKGR